MPVVAAELEGLISAAAPAGADAALTVVGVPVLVPASAEINTPTKKLTVAELLDPTPLPGRAQAGFLGGTAIVGGDFDTATGVLTATSIEVEPAENLLSGAMTAFAPPAINGVTVVLLPKAEPRLPGGDPINEFGFPVVLNNKVVDKLATADGYFDGVQFRAYRLEVDSGADLVSNQPQVSILRANFRERDPADQRGDGFDIRGAVTLMHAAAGVTRQRVEVFRLDAGVPTSLGVIEAVQDGEFPLFAAWRFTGETPLTNNPVLGKSPARVRAVNLAAGANGAFVDVDTDVKV